MLIAHEGLKRYKLAVVYSNRSTKNHPLFSLFPGDQIKISEKDLEAQFHALRRLVASKAGFRAFTTLLG